MNARGARAVLSSVFEVDGEGWTRAGVIDFKMMWNEMIARSPDILKMMLMVCTYVR